MPDTSTIPLIIGGERPLARDGGTLPVLNPATGEIIATVASATAQDIDAAVAAATKAFPIWSKKRPAERAAAMMKLAALMREHNDELGTLESQNVGKPIGGGKGEAGYAARVVEFYAGVLPAFAGSAPNVSGAGTGIVFREPMGVCGLITPWNFPLVIACWKLGPALAAGNTVVLKPAEWTPLTALRLGELALEAGFPEGVINVCPGRGAVAGASLTAHSGVRKVSFTGSTKTGQEIMRSAAGHTARVSLELGGKSASIVFADADLDKASGSCMSVFDNTGQDCCARSRYLVERNVFDEVVEKFVAQAKAIKVGDPNDEATELGPLVHPDHLKRVAGFVDRASAAGVKVHCGGGVPSDPELGKGCYYLPTVLSGAAPDSEIAQEEVFGPVVVFIPFDSEEEAIALANGTRFGLSGSIWTKDISRALRVARAVEAGVQSINTSSSVHLEMPFGGFKQSGIGRELGIGALEAYTEQKTVFIAE